MWLRNGEYTLVWVCGGRGSEFQDLNLKYQVHFGELQKVNSMHSKDRELFLNAWQSD